MDEKTARTSLGEYFQVGETVSHQDTEAGTATILSFELMKKDNEIRVVTDKGFARLDFIEKINDRLE